jgi:hypothetical protein
MRKRLRWMRHVVKVWLGVVVASILLLMTDAGLRVLGYKRMCRILLALSPTPSPERKDEPHARMIGAYINTAAASWLKATCLRRCLVTWWLLRWMRIPSEVRIGVNIDAGHAWVEHHGVVINDQPNIASNYRIHYGQELMPEGIARRI